MSGGSFVSFLALLLVFSITGSLPVRVSAKPDLRVHNIDTGQDYATIQESIDAPETLDEHTILVDAGIYYEHVIINKSLSLIGENRRTTVIDGNHTGVVMKILASNVNIIGFTMQNSGIDYPSCSVYVTSSCNTISDNIIANNGGGSGVRLHSSSNVISGNEIENNGIGIRLFNNSNNSLHGNNITDNGSGIMLDLYTSNNGISRNNISNNGHTGILSFGSFSNSIFRNSITANGYYGIYLSGFTSGSNENHICGNHISNNGNGIRLDIGSKNTISANNITNNNVGISLWQPKNNTFYHNNVLDNTNQVQQLTYDFANFWDNSVEGNYWSDYTGVDLNKDGIGDSPYVISPNNQDNYPLMDLYVPERALAAYRNLSERYNKILSDFNSLNATYHTLQSNYIELQENYASLQSSYGSLQGLYNSLNSTYTTLMDDLNNIRNLMYVFIATTIILTISVLYLAKKTKNTQRIKT